VNESDVGGRGRTVGEWPWRNVGHAIVGLGAGGYVGADLLHNKTSGWNLIGFYVAFAALFIVVAIIRRHYRTMFVSAYAGMTLAVAYILLFVTR
jgi:hypothetical protein